jgi:lysophospholipase L1-like esterase
MQGERPGTFPDAHPGWIKRSFCVHNLGVRVERGRAWGHVAATARRAWAGLTGEGGWRRLATSGGPLSAMVGVTALAASALPPHYAGNQLGPKVGIVGDSITCLSASDLESEFNSAYAYQIGCKNGITITQGTAYAQSIDGSLQGAPSAFIVNLGTNDALQASHDIGTHNNDDVGAAWKALTTLSSDLSNVSCVIWVTVSEVPDVFGSHVAEGINDWIHAWTSSHKGNYELDWWGLLQQGNNGALWLSTKDGIHTTDAGQKELASLYLHAEQQDCPQGGVIPNP